jgi:chaperonin GroEL
MKRREENKTFTYTQTPGVVFQPASYRSLQRGIHWIVSALQPTYGPLPRLVALQRSMRGGSPEFLDSGGVIARRIIDLPNADENVGAMYVRGMLYRIHEKVGDGTVTAAILFQSIFDQGLRYIAAGGNPMLLRQRLQKGMDEILEMLSEMNIPAEGQEMLQGIAQSVCYDAELAHMLGEIFDIIGDSGWLEIRSGRGRGLDREYVEGSYWSSGLHSRDMITDPKRLIAQLEDATILISNLQIEDPQLLAPVLGMAVQQKAGSMVIMARSISGPALGLLAMNQAAQKLRTIVVKTPGVGSTDQSDNMDDIAALTGGRPIIQEAGETLESVEAHDLGGGRRIWADQNYLGIIGGKGDPRKLRAHIAALRKAMEAADTPEIRQKLRERIGRLMGGSAVLWVGGHTESDMNMRKELAERTSEALRGAVRQGVLAGGGITLLECRRRLDQKQASLNDPEERVAYKILSKALEAPFYALMTNAGYTPGAILVEVERAGTGYGFDLLNRQITDMRQAGVYDVSTAVTEAVYGAVSSAALALTIDTLIHRRKPPVSTHPDEQGR